MQSLKIPCLDYELAADWYEGTGDEILLSLIGYSSHKGNSADLINAIVKQTGMSVLVFDYSGHGDSPFELKDVTPAQNFLEVVTVFDWLKEKYPKKTINVMGNSYGGFLATQLTKYREFNNLVLRVPAIYRPKDFYSPWSIRLDHPESYRKALEKYRTNKDELRKHPLFGRAANFPGKVLVVVHELDELVPKETTDIYIETFNADSFVAKGFEHSAGSRLEDREGLQAYQKAIADWLKEH